MTPSKTSPETDRFVELARKLVAVPKKEVDKRIDEERQQRKDAKEKKRKA